MSRHEATFEIESKGDAYAVRLLAETAYDALREELRHLLEDDTDPNETLQQFAAIREATRGQSAGSLTVIYERDDESSFDARD